MKRCTVGHLTFTR